MDLMDRNRGVMGFDLGYLWERVDDSTAHLRTTASKVADGTFAPTISATFDFDHASDTHAYIQDRKNFGEVLLTP